MTPTSRALAICEARQTRYAATVAANDQARASRQTADTILAKVCTSFGVTRDQLRGGRGHTPVWRARWAAYYLLRKRRGLATTQIGRIMRRDHSTVIHGIERAREMMRMDRAYMYQVIACGR